MTREIDLGRRLDAAVEEAPPVRRAVLVEPERRKDQRQRIENQQLGVELAQLCRGLAACLLVGRVKAPGRRAAMLRASAQIARR